MDLVRELRFTRNSQNFMMYWTRVRQGDPIILAPLLPPAAVYKKLNHSGNGKCQCQFLFLHFIGQKKNHLYQFYTS